MNTHCRTCKYSAVCLPIGLTEFCVTYILRCKKCRAVWIKGDRAAVIGNPATAVVLSCDHWVVPALSVRDYLCSPCWENDHRGATLWEDGF